MATKLATIIADFTTQLASELAVGGTTATLSSATDDDGVALPSGRYFFTLDGANSKKEHISCDLSGTTLTNIKTVSRQGVETAGVLRKHRIGSSIGITDFSHILQINALLAGITDLNSLVPLKYDGTPTISDSKHLATKAYVDSVAVAGAPNGSTTVKGIFEEATQAEVLAKTATGGTGADLVVNPSTMASTLLSDYKADTGAANAYVITPSPAITAYTAGQIFSFKATNANTTASTLNVNGLGVKTIKKLGGATDLASGDIAAGMIVQCEYDGTNFIMLNPVANAPLTATGDGSGLTNLPARVFKSTASATLQYSANTNRNNNNNGTVLVKSIRVNYSGTVRTSFDGQGNGFGGQGRIYVNGVATGTTRSFANGSYTTYSEDITVQAGNYVQVYSIATGGAVTDIKNYTVSFDTSFEGNGAVITD